MRENTLVATPRQVVLEELRGRLNARVAAVEKRLQLLQGEFEKLRLNALNFGPNYTCLRSRRRSVKTKIRRCELSLTAVAL